VRRASWLVSLVLSQGCRCSALSGEVDDHGFTRCVQADPPAERKVRAGQRTLSVAGRVAELSGPLPVRIAAFTGPVAGPLSATDVAEVAAKKPAFVWVLGGLGDDLASVHTSLAALAGLGVPVLLMPGGADRLALLSEGLAALSAGAADLLVSAAGLHELRVADERFALVSGAPDGRYAIDEAACGFTSEDTDTVAAAGKGPKGRSWLISWAAPAGLGLTTPPGAPDVGSPALAALVSTLKARGGVYAWPEGHYVLPSGEAPLHVVVPRLGRTGALAEGGGRLGRGVLMLHVDATGLQAGP
jgi:hypothetical protein